MRAVDEQYDESRQLERTSVILSYDKSGQLEIAPVILSEAKDDRPDLQMSDDERSKRGFMPENVVDKDGVLSVRLQQQFGGFQLDVDFQVPLGLIVLFGFSGAGKSLTLRGIAGLLHARQGYVAIDRHVLFDSEAGIDVPPQERHVGYVPQHYALFPHLTVVENISFALPKSASARGWRKSSPSQHVRITKLLDALELKGLERQYPATLSGGQQQRVALARALAAEPRLLLLDEPFNALDIAVRQRLRDSLKQFQRRFAIPIVLVTHDHEEVQQLADTVVALRQGQVQQVGGVQDVFFAPRTQDVAQLVGQQNIFGGYLAAPVAEQQPSPALALRLGWLQSQGARLVTTSGDALDQCWLPLPGAVPFSEHTTSSQTLITGCIRNDEVLVHRWSSTAAPPLWTQRGAVQWIVELLEVQIHGASIRLLVRPYWAKQLVNDSATAGGMLEIYLSRVRWREIEVMPGQALLLEIGPEAIHWFNATSEQF